MLEERGIRVNYSTIYRGVQKYEPGIERLLRWYWKLAWSTLWQFNETYIKVKGNWMYFYCAITNTGDTVDFYLSSTRNTSGSAISEQSFAKC
jgi:IS6 family transposase